MKNVTLKVIMLFIIIMAGQVCLMAQSKTPVNGKWGFEAPTAPEGFNWGVIEFKKDTALMKFTDGGYNIPSSWLKARGDSIWYETDIDGTLVSFSLKVLDNQKISGRAVWSGGETVMILTRKKE
jgi:hypothetical protein